MDSYLNISPGQVGWLVWLLWALIGVFGAFLMTRATEGRRILWFDLIIGAVTAVLGGWLSTRFTGSTPMQMFLISILGAVFGAGLALWLTGALVEHFRRDEDL